MNYEIINIVRIYSDTENLSDSRNKIKIDSSQFFDVPGNQFVSLNVTFLANKCHMRLIKCKYLSRVGLSRNAGSYLHRMDVIFYSPP